VTEYSPADVFAGRARWAIALGDVRSELAKLPDNSVHTVFTSPPYYGLRDYGVAGQIGLEPTLEENIRVLVDVFREVRRVLRADGTCWVNIGDIYAGGGKSGGGMFMAQRRNDSWGTAATLKGWKKPPAGLKPKDLTLLPARIALAMQADGWWLRAEIIWEKPTAMPEAARDRPTKSHEQLYLFSKSGQYFYDGFAIREPSTGTSRARLHRVGPKTEDADPAYVRGNARYLASLQHPVETRNARSVWCIPVDKQPVLDGDTQKHYATFPKALARQGILAGTSERGCCAKCGAPHRRLVEKTRLLDGKPAAIKPMRTTSKAAPSSAQGVNHARVTLAMRDVGWRATCSCNADIVPCVVLDPFMGSGTTALAAIGIGRRAIGIELNPEYVERARNRLRADSPLFDATLPVVAPSEMEGAAE
jgi:DNA modification methylase